MTWKYELKDRDTPRKTPFRTRVAICKTNNSFTDKEASPPYDFKGQQGHVSSGYLDLSEERDQEVKKVCNTNLKPTTGWFTILSWPIPTRRTSATSKIASKWQTAQTHHKTTQSLWPGAWPQWSPVTFFRMPGQVWRCPNSCKQVISRSRHMWGACWFITNL